jgi:AraC-like DNA-binding protein
MDGKVVDVLDGIDPASLSLREELLFHHELANRVAWWIGRLATYTPNLPNGGVGAKILLPEFGIEGIAPSFWEAVEKVAETSRRWPEVSNVAALSLAAGADAIGEQWQRGKEASYVVTTAVTASRIKRFHEAAHAAHREFGQSIPEIVAGHLEECVEDYPSSRIAEWVGEIECDDLFGVIDKEVAAALTWAATHLAPYFSVAPEAPRAERRSSANRGQTVSPDQVISWLREYHEKPDAKALQGKQIAEQTGASVATVTRAHKKVFGEELGQNGYYAAVAAGTVSDKLAAYEGDGLAFGTTDPRKLDR